MPARSADGKFLGTCAGGALARGGKHVGPGVQHLHQVIAAFFIREAQDVRLFREVQPGEGIEEVPVGNRRALKGGIRILAHVGELPQGGMKAFRGGHIGHH